MVRTDPDASNIIQECKGKVNRSDILAKPSPNQREAQITCFISDAAAGIEELEPYHCASHQDHRKEAKRCHLSTKIFHSATSWARPSSH